MQCLSKNLGYGQLLSEESAYIFKAMRQSNFVCINAIFIGDIGILSKYCEVLHLTLLAVKLFLQNMFKSVKFHTIHTSLISCQKLYPRGLKLLHGSLYNSHGPRPLSVSASDDASKVGSSSLFPPSSLPGLASPKTGQFYFFGPGNPVEKKSDGGAVGEEESGD